MAMKRNPKLGDREVRSRSQGPSEVQGCLRELEMAVRIHPEEAVNWYVLGRFLSDIGDNRRAESMLKDALRRSPESDDLPLLPWGCSREQRKICRGGAAFQVPGGHRSGAE